MCTNFTCRPAQDGTVVVGRSMEFPPGVPWNLAVVPADHAGTATLDAAHALTWTATHGIVGVSAFGRTEWILDGLNTAGLSGHTLYMDGGFCLYADIAGSHCLSEVDVLTYLLGTCATLAEVRQAIADVAICGVDPGLGFVPPVHYLLHDATGSLAIELHEGGEARVVDNPWGAGTNSPYLDWHLVNVRNYVGLTGTNPDAVRVDGVDIAPLGQGQGLKALPGSYTPPDRFVRAAVFTQLANQAADGAEAEQLAAHILNTFDIVPGVVREHTPAGASYEQTDWATISNLTQGRYAYRSFEDQRWYVIDLHATDFSSARTAALSTATAFTPATI